MKNTFSLKNCNFTFFPNRAQEVLTNNFGDDLSERSSLIGTSFYTLVHPEDVRAVSQLHRNGWEIETNYLKT